MTQSDSLRRRAVAQAISTETITAKLSRADGSVTPKSLRHYDSGQPGHLFMPVTYEVNGPGQVNTYRCDDTCGQHPRTATISSAAGDVITLGAAVSGQFFNDGMVNVVYLRIWNISKSPARPAWVKAKPASDQLQVIDAAAIAGWAAGETIQIGDDGTPAASDLRVFTIDISPIMQCKFGATFRQAGVVLGGNMIGGATAGDRISYTPSGANGSTTGLSGGVQVPGVMPPGGTAVVPCSEASPISNSNLLKFQEIIATTAATRLIRMTGIFV